jgi:RND superfamily putative drug exporter
MVAVFAVFATLSLQQFKQLAVGLGIAVLLDATVWRETNPPVAREGGRGGVEPLNATS